MHRLCLSEGSLELLSYSATGALLSAELLESAQLGFADVRALTDGIFIGHQRGDVSRFSFRDTTLHNDGFEETR